jgi:hypothetical protein
MQHPTVGKSVNPAIETATGTSLLQGIAAEQTRHMAALQKGINGELKGTICIQTLLLSSF